jgi:Transglycosylase-like domain
MAARPTLLEHDLERQNPPSRRTPPATRRSLAVLAAVVAVSGLVAFVRANTSGAADVGANRVRAIGGAPSLGPTPGLELEAAFVGLAPASRNGYWVAAGDGGVFSFGDAKFFGSAVRYPLSGSVVGIAPVPEGRGYWLAAADGGVFSFGDADFHGSVGGYLAFGVPLKAGITAIASTPSGHGYWLLAGDGGVFAFGDAEYWGSAAGGGHAQPFVSIAATASGRGYYLLEADGGVFAYGDAHFSGAVLDGKRATGITVPANGRGYAVSRSDGSVLGFAGAPSVRAPFDNASEQHPAIAVAARPGGAGAWIATGYVPRPPPPPSTPAVHNGFLACTRAHESDSAGGYGAHSSNGLYHGAYQFLQSTWDNVARRSGRYDLVGANPAGAAPGDQDQMALNLYRWQGAGPWGGRCARMN